jgi:hypothetical protein
MDKAIQTEPWDEDRKSQVLEKRLEEFKLEKAQLLAEVWAC